MTPESTGRTWRHKITIAAITGVLAGTARAIVTWALDHLTSN